MRAHLRTALVVSRAAGASVLAVASLATVMVWVVVPPRPIAVLGQSDVYAVIWPLVPAAYAAVVPAALAGLGRELEATSVRSAGLLR